MTTLNFEWQILEWFDKFKSTFMNLFNQYISLIFGSFGLILILFIIYWCLNKEKGILIAFNFFLAMIVNNFIKGFVKRKRPFNVEGHENLRKFKNGEDGATGSSFPSGHSMNSSALYGSIIANYNTKRHRVLQIICVVAIIIVGISRMYLGVHFPTDVFFGIIFGIVIMLISNTIQSLLGNKKIIFYLVIIAIFLPCIFFPNHFERDFYRSYGLILGFTLGYFLENRFVKFETNVSWLKRTIRLFIGFIVLGSEYLIYVLVPDFIHNNLYFTLFMHFLIVFSGFFIVPFIFKKLEKSDKKSLSRS